MLKNRITPKWVIFLLDLLVCAGAYLYANYLLHDFEIVDTNFSNLIIGLFIVSVTSSLCFFVFKTYEGIIRLSEIHETIRAISAVFCSFFLILLLNILFLVMGQDVVVPNSVLFIQFFVATFIISGYRIFVKTMYRANADESSAVNVIIFGAENKGLQLQKTIRHISGSQFKVVAFMEEDETLVGKSIDNLRIYSFKQLPSLIKAWHVKYLFFSRQDIDLSIKNRVVDECFSHNVLVKNIPSVKTWVQGNLHLNEFTEVKIEELLGRPAIELCNEEVVNYVLGKNVLITGAAGSIGSELANQVAAMSPASLIICDQVETGLHQLEYELQQKYSLGSDVLKFYLADVKDEAAMEQLFITYRPDVVFHAAAYKHVPVMEQHPSEAIRNNVLGTKIVADLSVRYGVDRFLFISTDKAINPTNIMGASKRIAEMYCHALFSNEERAFASEDSIVIPLRITHHRTKFITTRFGNVLASNGSVIPRFQDQIAAGGPVTVTHPEIIRYFMTISEACSLVLEAVTMGKGGEVFLFDMGEPVKILDLAKKMIMLAGYEPGKDISIVFSGLRPGEKLYEELLNKEEEVIPTHHKKILIGKMKDNMSDAEMNSIMHLIQLAGECNDNEVVKQMKRMLPQFISNNSAYQMFDNLFETAEELPLAAGNEI